MTETLLSVNEVRKHYPLRSGLLSRVSAVVKAVDGVSFDLYRGETLSIVGESGCGKSTLARNVMRLENPTEGSIVYKGKDLAHAKGKELFQLRREIQMIFQDPYSSLNPRLPVGEIVREAYVIHRMGSKKEQKERTAELFASVGLSAEMMDRYPHEFSGGQRQRIGVARALALEPDLIVADEPVSALDVSVQAQVINLLVELQRKRDLTYLFISHDLSVVDYISDRIAIMYLGRIVEIGRKEDIFSNPVHPYTRALIASAPVQDPRKRVDELPIEGELPSPINPPSGCPFHPRCPFATEECKVTVPRREPIPGETREAGASRHEAACIRMGEI